MAEAVTFDEIDRGMRELDVLSYEAAQSLAAGAAHLEIGLAVTRLAPVYRAVRPLLEALATTPLLPSKWKEVLRLFIATLDAIVRLAAVAAK